MNSTLVRGLSVFFICLPFMVFSQTDVLDEVASAVTSGNSKGISKYFDTNVEITILDKESVYSKAQAEMVLSSFFTKNPVQSFELIHRGNSGEGSAYAIGKLKTGTNMFRTYFFVKQKGNNSFIQEMRFEKQR